MSDNQFPYVRAAFINAIREEGTKAEACDYLQEQWNETCALRAEITRLRAQVEASRVIAKHGADTIATVLLLEIASALQGRDRVVLTNDATSLGPRVLEFAAALATYQQAKEGGE